MGITTHLENCGTIEPMQQGAAHESSRMPKLFDCTQDPITVEEVDRMRIETEKAHPGLGNVSAYRRASSLLGRLRRIMRSPRRRWSWRYSFRWDRRLRRVAIRQPTNARTRSSL
jgi:hypothetical protein